MHFAIFEKGEKPGISKFLCSYKGSCCLSLRCGIWGVFVVVVVVVVVAKERELVNHSVVC